MVKKLFSLKISLLIKYKHFFIVCISLLIGSLIYNFYSRTFPVFPNRVAPVIPYNFQSDFVKRPNIVLILLDDLDDSVSPYWEAMPVTRTLIKERGMAFINSFSPNPLCCPARASLLTGKYSHNTGVYNNHGATGGWKTFKEMGNEEKSFAVYLQKSGYLTSHIGKYLNGIEDSKLHFPPGWDKWYGGVGRSIYTGYNYTLNENGKLVSYGNKEKDYLTDVLSRKAVDFIKEANKKDDVPFLLSIAPTAPHYPILPAVRHKNHPFANSALSEWPNINESDISDKSSWLKNSADIRSLLLSLTTVYDYRARMGSLFAVDDLVSSVFEALADSGELENTYIIFTSDNGYNNGSHRLIQKMAPYEESQRVPLVISGPGIYHSVESDFALTIDLAPTILNLAGVTLPEDMDGMSLMPLLKEEKDITWREDYIAEHKIGGLASEFSGNQYLFGLINDYIDIPSYTALRNKKYLFIEWQVGEGGKKREYELYDMEKDRYQLQNLLYPKDGEAKYAELVKELSKRMSFLKKCSGKNCRI